MSSDTEILVGFWDCSHCGKKKILGDDMSCNGCGATRADNVEFYLADDASIVTDHREIQMAKAGPDWYCDHCNCGNSATRNVCSQCSAPRGSSKVHDASRDKISVNDYEDEESGSNVERISTLDFSANLAGETGKGSVRSFGNERLLQKDFNMYVAPPRSSEGSTWLSKIILLIIFGIVAIGLFTLFRNNDVELRVASISWNRSISLEKYITLTENGWSVPHGGRTKSVTRKHHHDEKILDHYETKVRQLSKRVFSHNERKSRTVSERYQSGTERYHSGTRSLGNGRFEKTYSTRPTYSTRTKTVYDTVPVYKTVYYPETYKDPVYRYEPRYQDYYVYDIERWVPSRTERSSGFDANPKWPTYREIFGLEERECGRSEDYAVTLNTLPKGDGEKIQTFTLKPSFAQWQSFKVGDLYTAKMTITGTLTELKKSVAENGQQQQ